MSARYFLLLSLFLSFPSYAHENNLVGGFITGMLHPVLGLDHLLAMMSVGVLSSQMGGKAIGSVPAAFVVMMVIGGVLGLQEVKLPLVEVAIGLSVLCLGIAIAFYKKMPMLLAMVFIGFFAVFHGHAHGVEMPYIADAIIYSLGFVTGTAAIHIVGVIFAWFAARFYSGKAFLRYLGAGIAGIGFAILFL